jgi:hypothetical protein
LSNLISVQQLADGYLDLNNIGAIANGAANAPDIKLRLGGTAMTLRKAAASIAKGDKGDAGLDGTDGTDGADGVASLVSLATLRVNSLPAGANMFNPVTKVLGYFVDIATGDLVAKSGCMATDFIPANSGGKMILNKIIDAIVVSSADPYLSTSANLLTGDSSLWSIGVLLQASTGLNDSHGDSYQESPYFIVANGQTYTTNLGLVGGQWGIVYYDAAMNFLGGDGTLVYHGANPQVLFSFTVPTNLGAIKYARMGVSHNVDENGPNHGLPTSPFTTFCPSLECIILGTISDWNTAYPSGACPPAFAGVGSVTYTNGLCRYDENKVFIDGVAGAIAADTAQTVGSSVGFWRAGFTSDVSASLMINNGDTLASTYQGFGTYPPNVIDAKIADATGVGLLASSWPAMAGLDTWITLRDGAGTVLADASGNNLPGVITGDATTPAVWRKPVGLDVGTQTISIANASGRPTIGFCAYFPVGGRNPFLGATAAGGQSGMLIGQTYGIPLDHGAMAFFPCVGQSNGSPNTIAKDGISGIHCIEIVAGDGGSLQDIMVIDGHEVQYSSRGDTHDLVGGAQLTNALLCFGTYGTIYSIWAASTRDTVSQAIARCKSEMTRLSSLGVKFGYPDPTWKTDSVLSITGTSIDQGFQASGTPASRLALDFPCTIYNLSISGQASKDMDAGYEDREAPLYNIQGQRNIAWHGGVTNSLTNYLQSPANALLDVLAWNRKAKAQGYQTVVSTMISRSGNYVTGGGSTSYTGDQLAQAFNALLLANGDEFDWVANLAADPILGATGASANTTYFADGTHPNDTGQALWLAIMRAGVEGVYGNPITIVSANYTQIDSDRLVVQTSSSATTFTLKNANYQSFNRAGVLKIKNIGTGTLTVAAFSGQTINGSGTVTVAAGASLTLYPFVLNPAVGGAEWLSL